MEKVFGSIPGLRKEMVTTLAKLDKANFDLIVVDEAHRLRKFKNLGNYGGRFKAVSHSLGLVPSTTNEMEWVLLKSKKAVLFYDSFQSIKPSDIDDEQFTVLKSSSNTKVIRLKEQLRSQGGTQFSEFLERMFSNKLMPKEKFLLPVQSEFEFTYFDSIHEIRSEILKRDEEVGLSRLIAGFSWEWKTKNRDSVVEYDIEIDGLRFKWNTDKPDWINYEGSHLEVGCIHKTQGYDLNYCGIIFGKEIDYDWDQHQFTFDKNEYKDVNGKNGVKSDERLLNYLLNIYKTCILRGIKGCYIFSVNPGMKKFLKEHLISFTSK